MLTTLALGKIGLILEQERIIHEKVEKEMAQQREMNISYSDKDFATYVWLILGYGIGDLDLWANESTASFKVKKQSVLVILTWIAIVVSWVR